MNTEALKEEARRHEQREDWAKALDLYLKAIEGHADDDDPDIALHNRVGDLQIRLGDLDGAVASYERATDLYLAAELPNNAIAICRKIIRSDPTHPGPFLRMSQVRARQGFLVDARQNLLTYVEMMQARSDTDEVVRALEEFAALAPEDVETAVFLGDLLMARGREEDAVAQFTRAFRALKGGDREEEARELRDRVRNMVPDFTPEEGRGAGEHEEVGPGVLAGFESTSLGGEPLEARPDVEPPAEFELDPDLGAELDLEIDSEVDPALASEPDREIESEVDPGTDSELDFDLGPEPDSEVSLNLGLEPDSEVGSGREMDDDLLPLPTFGDLEEEPEGEGNYGDQPLSLPEFTVLEENEEDIAVDLPAVGDLEDEEVLADDTAEHDETSEADELVEPRRPVEVGEASGSQGKPGPDETPGREAIDEDQVSQAGDEGEGGEYVDLGALVLDEERDESTRWVVPTEEPSGDEDADFARMLAQFKEKVAKHLTTDDARAHYDLGTAYKEMGLLDEAIGEFQQALRADPSALPTYEMLGLAFLEKEEPGVAIRTFERALKLPYRVEDDLLGIYYSLGRAHQRVGNTASAGEFYEKVFALDINFKDVTARLREVRPTSDADSPNPTDP